MSRVARTRLLRHAAATARWPLGLAAAAAVADAVLIVAVAAVLADTIAAVVTGGAGVAQVRDRLLLLVFLISVRAGLAWLATALPQRAAAEVKARLRTEVVAAATGGAGSTSATGEVAAIAVRGLDALDPYFARYLPELIRAATIPAAVVLAMLARDLTAGLIVLVTLPLIPLFGILVGGYTERRTRRQWRVLAVLSHHFLDIVRGLPTLKVFGRAQAQAANIAKVTEQHRTATMATLRVALLSALVLELAATLSVAVVAVSVGLRLVHGGLALQTALFLLILAPEAYLPWRRAAAEYHAAAEGVAAAADGFAVIDAVGTPRLPVSDASAPVGAPLTVERVTVRYPRRCVAALSELSLVIPRGQVTAVVGPSGCGKSTLLSLLLGLRSPDGGQLRLGSSDLGAVDLGQWHRSLAWLPQRPSFVTGSVRDNITLGRPNATADEVRAAADRACLTVPLDARPELLSAGERQRLALARVFLRTDAALVLLDEPTAHLDPETEQRVCAALAEHALGRTVVLVSHREAPLRLADHVIDLGAVTVR